MTVSTTRDLNKMGGLHQCQSPGFDILLYSLQDVITRVNYVRGT